MQDLISLGLDIGTSTTQLVFSRLHIANRAGAWAVPELVIDRRELLYESPVRFTPLRSDTVIDAEAIRALVDEEYRAAGMDKAQVKTGAVIITGETARKENAAQVLQALSGCAGDFVVATAGADLESRLAARGAGADQYAAQHRCPLIHIDIGGGTSNFAVFDGEQLLDVGCLNVGGRLVKLDEAGTVTYVSPVLRGLCTLQPGQRPAQAELEAVAALLARALEQAAGLAAPEDIPPQLITTRLPTLPMGQAVLSFSGGVGALLEQPEAHPPLEFGDLGVLLARAIARSRLMQGPVRLCPDAIRATVIGAGSHTTQLSGSTIVLQDVRLPLRSIPVVCLPPEQAALPPEQLARAIEDRVAAMADESGPQTVALALDGEPSPSFARICQLARGIAAGLQAQRARGEPMIVLTRCDMAKALGHAILCELDAPAPLACLDGLSPGPGSYLDLCEPVPGASALPVVIKTLILGESTISS